jgi:hypothetical protein
VRRRARLPGSIPPLMVQSQRLLKGAEWTIAILLSALAFFFLVLRAVHAGGLWRDECAVVQLASMPSVSDIFHNFQHEAFPPAFPVIVRAYMALFGSTDGALRFFGLVVGCFLIGAFWINARHVRNDVPLIALALTSLNTTFFVWGTTIRGYGLGSAMVVLIFGCICALLLGVTWPRILAAGLVCLFGVQILLYNTVLLLAIGAAAMVVLLFQQKFKQLLLIVVICAVGVFFLLPYVPAYLHARDWNILVRGWPTSYSLWKHFEVALGNPGYSIPAIWYAITVGLVGIFIFRLYRKGSSEIAEETQLVWFAILACGMSVVGCYGFLRILSYTTSNWYYLAFICVAAAALDLSASILFRSTWLRLCRLIIAIAALVIAPFADWSTITERQTNVDVAARVVTERAAADDLVLVVPWQFGIPFNRYYRGSAPWKTIPNIEDHGVHRYDLFKQKMLSLHPVDDLKEAVSVTLASGAKVWIVGGLNLPPAGQGPMLLPPAPDSRFKWDNRAYTAAWWQQLSVFIALHARNVESIALPLPESVRVNELEQTSLAAVEGWH